MEMPTNAREKTSYALSPQAKRLLAELAGKLAVTRTAVLELAIRRLAEQHGATGEAS